MNAAAINVLLSIMVINLELLIELKKTWRVQRSVVFERDHPSRFFTVQGGAVVVAAGGISSRTLMKRAKRGMPLTVRPL
jgi:hypothetical protein